MTPQELAEKLTGIEYPCKIDKALVESAKQHGLVIVYGASDDLMEFEGAIYDELARGGTTAHLDASGLIQNECEEEDCPYFARLLKNAVTIKALWAEEGDYSWTFKTQIPHATFEVVEDGAPYCRGLVFKLADVDATPRG
jgi:hypothetical protein